MFLTVDQFGNKTILKDIKHKTLRERFCAGKIVGMFCDSVGGGKTYQTGFVIGQGHGNSSLWLTVYELTPMKKAVYNEKIIM